LFPTTKKTERGHLVRLSAKRETVAGIHYQQVSALRALAGKMPALRCSIWTLSFNSITIAPPY